MTPPPSWREPENLLADHAWARRLARRLVRDAAEADDLAQEACARALEHPPSDSLRAWLGGVLRNLARQGRRARGRREGRERVVARAEAQPSTLDALTRLAVQQDVVRAVLALAEPYRSTIVARFYEGLPPRKIAARAGVPVATVKTRLARGLAELRATLDREHGGDGKSWALFLLPLARSGSPLTPGTSPMISLARYSLLAVSACLVVWWTFGTRGSGSPAQPVAPSVVSAEPRAVEPSAPAPSAPSNREAVSSAAGSSGGSENLEQGELLSGRVIDATGAPVAGVRLGLRGANGARLDRGGDPDFGSVLWTEELHTDAEPLALSAADGSFEFVRPPQLFGRMCSPDAHWETVLAPWANFIEGHSLTLVVAPSFALGGHVVDETGQPIAGAELRFAVPRARIDSRDADMLETIAGDWGTTSATDGSFAFARLPSVPGARLRARKEPFGDELIEREAWAEGEIEIVLKRPQGAWLEGVVEADGQRQAGATVVLGQHATKTDEHGAFALSLTGREHEEELCAIAPGFLPARIQGDRNADGSVRWPSSVQLTLAGEPLALAGVVVDENGAPLADQQVWLRDGNVVESDGFPVLLESLSAGSPDARLGTKTDAQGHFRLGGLEARAYRLQVVDHATALVLDEGPYTGGNEDVHIQRPAQSTWPIVRGVVVSRAGAPIAGVTVYIERELDSVGVGDRYFGFHVGGAKCTSDEQGAFELHDVPRSGVQLTINDLGIADPQFELEPGMDPLALRVVVDSYVDLRVDVGHAYPQADTLGAVDSQGHWVLFSYSINGGSANRWSVGLQDGRSPVVQVGDQATAVVLLHGSEELARVPIALHAEGLNTLDL